MYSFGKDSLLNLLFNSSDVDDKHERTRSLRIAHAGTLSLSNIAVVFIVSNKAALSVDERLHDEEEPAAASSCNQSIYIESFKNHRYNSPEDISQAYLTKFEIFVHLNLIGSWSFAVVCILSGYIHQLNMYTKLLINRYFRNKN